MAAPKQAPDLRCDSHFISRIQIFHRLRIYLQSNMRQSGNWTQRASRSVCQPELEGDEIEYQFFLSIEHGNPAAKAIYVHILPVDTIDEIVNSKGSLQRQFIPTGHSQKKRLKYFLKAVSIYVNKLIMKIIL